MHRTVSSTASTPVVELATPALPFTADTHLVSPAWLAANLGRVRVLDASWYMPAAARDTRAEFEARHIPGAAFFDVDGITDHSTDLPHMLPRPDQFSVAMAALGVSHDMPVVAYDTAGLFSAARVWWTLRAFGHSRVAVLHGGWPRWLAEGGTAETGPSTVAAVPGEAWEVDARLIRSADSVLATGRARGGGAPPSDEAALDLLVDARAAGRFTGEVPEPRPHLSSGHMPGAKNVPFSALLDAGCHNRFLDREPLLAVFRAAGVDVGRRGAIVASCGSGVTASAVSLALAVLGRPPHTSAVYDGSWTEYAALPGAPIVKGPA